jgi:TolB-like protein/Flp pilus assembly protein TadD
MMQNHSFLSATLAELNRRKVLRTVGAYAVGVFVLLQLMDAAVEPLRLPEWLPTLVVIVLILGFPLVFLLAWQFEVTPQGVRRTQAAGLLSRSQNTFLFAFMLLAMAGLGSVFYQYYSGVFEPGAEERVVQREFKAPQNSIAVLPFTDLSEEGDQGYFSDGLSEEILNLLARVEGLHVAARTSSFALRNPNNDIREIGRLLNVATVLEGSVRTAGNRIRLTAQLINVEDGYHIWSKSYDREMDDIFALQDEVASSIAGALVDSFAGLETKPAGRSDNLAASQAYRTGRLHWWRRTPDELQRAIELFATALENDATFAPAYAALADTYLLLSLYGNISMPKAVEKGQPMIEKALEIDPGSAEAFAALGLARWQLGQTDAAESALRQAVRLDENYVPAQLWLAGVLGEQGRYPEERLVLEKAMELDPLNELLAVNYSTNLARGGDWASAREIMQGLVDLRPDSTTLLRSMAMHEIEQGNLSQGWKLARRSYELQPDNPEDTAALATSWIVLGKPDEAERLLLPAMEQSDQNINLLGTYWKMLVVAKRYELAESLVRDIKSRFGEEAPAGLARMFDFQLGLIAMIRDDYATAVRYLDQAVGDMDNSQYLKEEILYTSLAAYAHGKIGSTERAGELMDISRRLVQRARLNGVNNANLAYTEAVLLAMNDEPQTALSKLEQAYERGFREQWLVEIDARLDPLRGMPEFVAWENRIEDDINRALAEIRAIDLAIL